MIKIISFFAFINILFVADVSGQNLITNYSFEQFGSNVWRQVKTVDFLSIGINEVGFVTASHGSNCVGLRFSSPIEDDWQEYISQNISGKFDAGKTYKVSFKYRLAGNCVFSTDDLGVGFVHNWGWDANGIEPQIDKIDASLKNPENAIITNYGQYKQFSQFYTATGTENHIVIGCFKKDIDLTSVPIYNPTSNPMPDIYFLIDEVEVFECPPMPESLLENSYVACDQMPFELDVQVSADELVWSNGSDSSSTQISPNEDLVWLEATFGECKMRDTMSIQRFSGSSDLGSDILICGANDLPLALKVHALPNESVVWNTGHNEPILRVDSPGHYSVVKSFGTCVWSDEIDVIDLFEEMILYPNPTINEIHFENESAISILKVTTEDGKRIISAPISVLELNQLIKELVPANYFLDVQLNSCFKRLKLCLIN